MATQITDENFEQYFDEYFDDAFVGSMEDYGKAVEDNTDVPEVTGSEVAGEDVNYYSMPLVKNQSNVMSYAKVPLGGQQGLIKAVADEVQTSGFMEAITQAEFDEIFT